MNIYNSGERITRLNYDHFWCLSKTFRTKKNEMKLIILERRKREDFSTLLMFEKG